MPLPCLSFGKGFLLFVFHYYIGGGRMDSGAESYDSGGNGICNKLSICLAYSPKAYRIMSGK